MDIHEYQAKELLAGFGVAIPRGGVAYSPEQAVYRASEIGGDRWAGKAQIHSRARGKAGEALKKLLHLQADKARLVTPDGEKEVPASMVRVGDLVAEATGESKVDARARVARGQGVLAEGLTQGQAQALAANFRLLNKAPLRLGVLPTIGPVRLSRFLAAFQSDYPGIEVTVEEGPLGGLTQRLADGKLDIAVLSSPVPLGDEFRTTLLYAERYVVALPPEHRLQHRNAIKLADLSGEAYVDRLSCELREMVMAVCGERKVELYARFRSEREDWVQGMVLGNLGFAFMPEYSITVAGLPVRPLIEPTVERQVMAVTVPGRPHSPAREAFMRALKSHKWP